MIKELEPLANTYHESIIWDFLKTKGITKDNISKCMDRTLSTDSGCGNEDCELNYNGADQEFLEVFNVGYEEKENRFLES